MTFKVDDVITKRFNRNNYSCKHFTADVWFALTGQDFRERMFADIDTAVDDRRAVTPLALGFKRIPKPVDPCIVIMQSPGVPPHVAVYLRKKVLQIHEAGVEFSPLPIAMRSFRTAKFYA